MLARWASLIIVVAVTVPITIWHPYNNWPPIRADGLGYHLWTRAILKRDLSFCSDLQASVPIAISYRDTRRGICLNRYPPGLALLRFPIMAPLVDLRPGAPLVSPAEHWATLVTGGIALALVCLLALLSARLLSVDAWSAHVAILTFVFGAGLFHEATYESSFTHIYSALGFALLIWLFLRERSGGRGLPVLVTFLTTFLLLLIRNTNGLALAILLFAYLLDEIRRAGMHKIWAVLTGLVPALAGTGLGTAAQIIYNAYATHTLRLSSYGPGWFQFKHPMQLAVFFSYENGVFIYAPVLAIALVAALLIRRTRQPACLFALVMAAFAILYGFSINWGLKLDLGNRGFVELMPIGMVLFAVALCEMPVRLRAAVTAASCAATFVHIELMLGYWRAIVPFIHMTGTSYWAYVVGKQSLFVRLFGYFRIG